MKIITSLSSCSDSTSSSKIYHGHDETGRRIVLKKSKRALPIEQQTVVEAIFGLQHPNLLLPLEWENNNGYFTEIYEFVDWPRLDRTLEPIKKSVESDPKTAIKILLQLTDVLGLFHSYGMIHHDVRQQNMFVNPSSLLLKLFDVNCAARPYYLKEGRKTWDPVPPEYRRGNSPIDFRYDVWQAGRILKDITHVCNWKGKPEIPIPNFPKSILEVIDSATSEDLERRYKNCREFHEALKSIHIN
jgi:serine/threonine protein kinase